jgi:hypothetical protein
MPVFGKDHAQKWSWSGMTMRRKVIALQRVITRAEQRMGRRVRDEASGRDSNEARTLEMMLDYAIVEGAALRLPLFVLLLRAAQLELTAGLAGRGGPGRRRIETKLRDCLGAYGVDSFGAPGERPQGSPNIVQDW